MTTTSPYTTARALADLAFDVSDYERHWRLGGGSADNSEALAEAQARIDRGTEELGELLRHDDDDALGLVLAHQVRRALIEAAASNRADSVGCRTLDERWSGNRVNVRFAYDLTRSDMRKFVADHEC